MSLPAGMLGLGHVALRVHDLEACERFYVGLLGMRVEWRPDPDNLYLTHGRDNLALHREQQLGDPLHNQRLDHIGFFLDSPAAVDRWFEHLSAHRVPMRHGPRTHRDGARSFYCFDPEGNCVQLIYHPPVAADQTQ